ncbi:MAG: hypothetical protein ABSC94_20510 [Polyangiaceae bacterium]
MPLWPASAPYIGAERAAPGVHPSDRARPGRTDARSIDVRKIAWGSDIPSWLARTEYPDGQSTHDAPESEERDPPSCGSLARVPSEAANTTILSEVFGS